MRRSLGWYRALVEASAPDKLHSMAPDEGGTPRMTVAFTRYITEERTDLQRALARLHRGSTEDQVGAIFLFVLACSDFEPAAAGARIAGCHHVPRCARCERPTLPLPSEYCAWYAEKAIHRLRETIARREQPRSTQRKPWMDRVGLAPASTGR